MHTVIKETKITHKCWRDGDLFYKQLPKYNADNEMFCLERMQQYGFVPRWPNRIGLEIVSMEFIEEDHAINPDKFMGYLEQVLLALAKARIVHGDLTEYSVLVKNNRPVLVDFAESRPSTSPISPKRPEGDRYWLERTMRKIAYGS